jgi:16S rRNA (guanine966-N2)-methyltransferase
MRIISGEWRGRPITAPEGQATRPTSDRAREGLFSMLQSRVGSFHGLHVADLFAGTGALGLEALSRGAAHCLFLDSDRNAVASIQRNVAGPGCGRARGDPFAGARICPAARDSLRCAVPRPALPHRACRHGAGAGLQPGLGRAGRICQPRERRSDDRETPGFEVEAERRFGKAHILLLRRVA